MTGHLARAIQRFADAVVVDARSRASWQRAMTEVWKSNAYKEPKEAQAECEAALRNLQTARAALEAAMDREPFTDLVQPPGDEGIL